MTHQEMAAKKNAGRATTIWALEDKTGEVHYRALVMALLPAAAILAASAAVLTRLLLS